MLRAAIDTQVWVRAFLRPGGSAGAILQALRDGKFELVTAEPLLRELEGVFSRPKFARKHGRSLAYQRTFSESIRQAGDIVAIDGSVGACRDPKDDMLIEAAIRGGVSYLVSADEDLHATEVLEHMAPHRIKVVTVPEFLAALRGGGETEDGTDGEVLGDA